MIVGFLSLIPLKIEDIVRNLENHFYSVANNDASSEVDKIFRNYFEKYVGPAMMKGECSSSGGHFIISRDCNFMIPSTGKNNPIRNLYRTYQQAKVENLLADKGIEIQYDTTSKQFYLKAPGLSGEGDVIGDSSSGIVDSEFVAVDRGAVRAAAHSVEEDATLWQKVMLRYKIGRLLEEKYGIKRCLVFCGVKDFFANIKSTIHTKIQGISNTIAAQKDAAKIFLVDRVITPHSAALGTIFGCLLSTSSSCSGKNTGSEVCDNTSCDELDGETESVAADSLDEAEAKVTEGFASETADKIVTKITDIKSAGGLTRYLINELSTELAGKEINLDIPGYGELSAISTIASLVKTLVDAPKTLRRLTYVADAAAAVNLYMEYRTFTDEIHTGHVNANEVGSFVTSLSSGDHCALSVAGSSCSSSEMGGTASAEQTPLYSNIMDGNNNPSSSPNYKCNNGNPVPSGQLVCPEEQLGQSSSALQDISSFFQSTGLATVANAVNAVFSTPGVHQVFNASSYFAKLVFDTVKVIPGFSSLTSSLTNFIGKEFGKITNFLINHLVPTPFSTDMSGGRTFDMMAAGADVSGNDYAHTVLGGKMLTSQQVAVIQNNQTQEQKLQFAQLPLFERLFSTTSPYSLLSKIAIAMPFTLQGFINNIFVSYIQNPFNSLISSFGDIMSAKVNAQTTPQPDPFGIVQYGYTQADLNAIGDPATYWDQNCSNNSQNAYQNNNSWNSSAVNLNNTTSDPGENYVNQTTNPCLLIMNTVGAMGGMFNTNLLTSGDLADTNITSNNNSSSSSTTSSYQNPFREIQSNLVPGIIDQGVDYSLEGPISSNEPIYAVGDGTIDGIYPNGYNNEPLIAYTLSDGPAQGKVIYLAECITPAPGVVKGEQITSNTVIAQMTNCGNGIETGWADPNNLPDSMAKSCWDQVSSSFGVNFSQFLVSLGAPAGTSQETNPPCTLPSGWPTWVGAGT